MIRIIGENRDYLVIEPSAAYSGSVPSMKLGVRCSSVRARLNSNSTRSLVIEGPSAGSLCPPARLKSAQYRARRLARIAGILADDRARHERLQL